MGSGVGKFRVRAMVWISYGLFLSKTLEHAVSQQMESNLSSAGLLPRHQSAYRKGHSTETALVKVCSDLIGMMDSSKHALLALLDLSSTLDMVNHDILLTRLS